MQDMNNTPNTEQNRSSSSADEWKELMETPEVMSSSCSPSSRDNPAPAEYPWEFASSSGSSSSSKVSITWITPEPEEIDDSGDSEHIPIDVTFETEVYEDTAAKLWRVRLLKAEGKTIIKIYKKGFRDADMNPPVNEVEAIDAVNTMNNYRIDGAGLWHTLGASRAHENYHRMQWMDASNFYWEDSRIQETVEAVSFSNESHTEGEATSLINDKVAWIRDSFNALTRVYISMLPDRPGNAESRAYRAGQFELNRVTARIEDEARSKNWTQVPWDLASTGDFSKPCHLPPVSQMYGSTRSTLMNVFPCVPEEDTTQNIQMDLVIPQDIQNDALFVVFRNNGERTARLLDKFTPTLIRDVFFDLILMSKQGKNFFRSFACSQVTFQGEPGYLDILPGAFHEVSIPLHDLIREQCPEGLPAGECTLSVTYHNKYGEDCVRGSLQVTENVLIE